MQVLPSPGTQLYCGGHLGERSHIDYNVSILDILFLLNLSDYMILVKNIFNKMKEADILTAYVSSQSTIFPLKFWSTSRIIQSPESSLFTISTSTAVNFSPLVLYQTPSILLTESQIEPKPFSVA